MGVAAAARSLALHALRERAFDVLVVGGGINGAAVACELAQQGLAVALIDRGDFASATSQSSGNLIWGGIKYLEHGHLGLVARLCAERRDFLVRAPHCVRERRFLAPCFRGDPHGLTALAWGARLHWALGGFLPSHRPEILRTPADVLRVAPHLQDDRLVGGVLFTDAQIVTSDAHLTFEIVRTAAAAGAIALNYMEATRFRTEGTRITGADVSDRLTGAAFPVAARLVVNATGIWADRTSVLAGATNPPHKLVLRRGTFLHLRPDDFDAPREAVASACVIVRAEGDHRPFFIYPWGPVIIVGTTDVDHDPASLDDVHSTPGEFEFLLRELEAKFRLKPGLGPDRVVETRVGVRPLAVRSDAAPDGFAGQEALALSRDHVIDLDRGRGLFTVLGGKITPARRLAADLAHKIARHFPAVWGRRPFRDTRGEPIASATDLRDLETFTTAVREAADAAGLDGATADHLIAHHGSGATALLARVNADRSLAEPVIPGLPYRWVEIREHAAHGMVATIDDVLRRRTNLAQWTPFGGFGAAGEHAAAVRRVAEEICRAHGWPPARTDTLVDDYRQLVDRRNAWRAAVGSRQ